MYDPNDSFQEILRRAAVRRKKRHALMQGLLAGGTGATLFLLILWVALSPSKAVDSVGESMGAFLLDMKTGGYVLVALAAFATGAFLTAYFVKRHADQKAKSEQNQNGGENNENEPKL